MVTKQKKKKKKQQSVYVYILYDQYKSICNFKANDLYLFILLSVQFSSVAQWCPALWPHESQHARPPCPSPTPRVYSNSCPSSRWCHPTISSSVVPFSSCPQSLPASGSFPMSQLFSWGGQSTVVSASASFCFQFIYNWVSILYISGPPPFCHQGLIWWKTAFSQIRGGVGGFRDATSTLHLFCTLFLFFN